VAEAVEVVEAASAAAAGVDLSKYRIQSKYLESRGGNKWWNHKRFSIIEGTFPGCPKSTTIAEEAAEVAGEVQYLFTELGTNHSSTHY